MTAPRPGRFPRAHRLSHARQFAAVYGAKVRVHRGPLTIFSAPNDLPHCRLGLSVGRRVGNAIVRNRVKRLIRDAFRLNSAALPPGFDLVVAVRKHDGLSLEQYEQIVREAGAHLRKVWDRKLRRAAREDGADS